MNLSVLESGPGHTLIALVGRLDATAVEEIRARFLEATGGAARPAVVDLAGVTFLASLGIWMLVEAAKAIQASGHRLALAAPRPLVEKSLRASGFARMLEIHPDLAGARRALGLG